VNACPNALRVITPGEFGSTATTDTAEAAWCDQPVGHDGPHTCSQDGYSVAWTSGGDVTWSVPT
jgi:hypothetical protein